MPLFSVHRDTASAGFFDGTAAGLFLLIRDRESGMIHAPGFDTSVAPERWEQVPASGSGRVVSWSVVHHRGVEATNSRIVVGIVELDEGPWWWTELVGADPDADLQDAPVTLEFVRVGDAEDDEVQPVFRVQADVTGRAISSVRTPS